MDFTDPRCLTAPQFAEVDTLYSELTQDKVRTRRESFVSGRGKHPSGHFLKISAFVKRLKPHMHACRSTRRS